MEGTLKKLSSGVMGKKWQERVIAVNDDGITQRKTGDDAKLAKLCFGADEIDTVVVNATKNNAFEICINKLAGGDYKLQAETQAEAKRWAEAITKVSPAGKAIEAQAKKEIEAKAMMEAEQKAKLEAEAKAKEAEQAKKADEEQANKEAEDQAKKAAEEQAKKEAEDQAKKAAEEQAKKAAEQQVVEPATDSDAIAEAAMEDSEEALADMWASEESSPDANTPEEENEAEGDKTMSVPKPVLSKPATPPKLSRPKPSVSQRPSSSGDSGSVFDRLSSSYTGTSKFRRQAVSTQRGFRGMDGHVGRQSGTGMGANKSWLDVGMEETRHVAYEVYAHKTVGSDARGGLIAPLSVHRFQEVTDGGHYRSKGDLEESAQRDIECVDKSTFSQFASTKSQFGTHSGMGMGGMAGNRFGVRMAASGHFLSACDLEEAAQRDYLQEGSLHASAFGSCQKSLTTRAGMAMGGAKGNRFQITDAKGRIIPQRELEEAAQRDFLTEEASLGQSSFASALKKGNPNFSVLGGKVGRFDGIDSMYSRPALTKGPGDYSAEEVFDKLPMPARAVQP